MKLWVERNQGSVCSNIEENYSSGHDLHIKEDETRRDKRYTWACKHLTVVKTFMYIKRKSWGNSIIIRQISQLKNQMGKELEWTFPQRRNTDCQQTRSTSIVIRECDWNHKEIPLPGHWTAMRKQPWNGKQQVLARMWRNGRPHPCWWGWKQCSHYRKAWWFLSKLNIVIT